LFDNINTQKDIISNNLFNVLFRGLGNGDGKVKGIRENKNGWYFSRFIELFL
jgi:hypothetical protein